MHSGIFAAGEKEYAHSQSYLCSIPLKRGRGIGRKEAARWRSKRISLS